MSSFRFSDRSKESCLDCVCNQLWCRWSQTRVSETVQQQHQLRGENSTVYPVMNRFSPYRLGAGGIRGCELFPRPWFKTAGAILAILRCTSRMGNGSGLAFICTDEILFLCSDPCGALLPWRGSPVWNILHARRDAPWRRKPYTLGEQAAYW